MSYDDDEEDDLDALDDQEDQEKEVVPESGKSSNYLNNTISNFRRIYYKVIFLSNRLGQPRENGIPEEAYLC